MVIETLVLGQLMVTAYRSIPKQTDNTPFITSIGHRTHPFGCAVSRDLLASGKVAYGDYLIIDGIGTCVVNDTTAIRHINLVDKWVSSYDEEKALKPGKRNVIRIRGNK